MTKEKILKKLINFIGICFLMITLISCSAEEETYAYILLDFSAKIEIVIDNNEKIKAVNGLNDEGKMILFEETYDDKKMETCISDIVKESVKLGYIVRGDEKEFCEKIIISVAGSFTKDDLHIIEMKVNESIQDLIFNHNLDVEVEIQDNLSNKYFENKVLIYKPWLEEIDIQTLNNNELMVNIKDSISENSQFSTVLLEEYYQLIKEFAYKIKYKNIILENINSTYADLLEKYQGLVKELEVFFEEYKTKENMLFDIDFTKMNEEYIQTKIDYLSLRAEIASKKTNNDTLYSALISLEKELDDIKNNVFLKQNSLYSKVNEVILNFDTTYAKLDELERNFLKDFDFISQKNRAINYISGAKDNMYEILKSSLTPEKLMEINDRIKTNKKTLKNKISL